MSYYNKNYYPTPPEVIDLMIKGLDLKGKIVLDPSAGMGAILDKIKYTCKKTYAIELEYNFQETLKGKGHTVLHSDFLTYSGNHAFDFILMNPPFDNGVKHFLKALEIAKPSTQIVCLLNWESINNPYSEDRQRLIKEVELLGGSIENIGNVFSNADRKTNVEVGMIKVTKPATQSKSFNFDDVKTGSQFRDFTIDGNSSELERYNKIEAFCRAYNKAVEQLPVMYQAMKELELFTSPFVSDYDFREMIADLLKGMTGQYSSKKDYTESHNEFVKKFQGWAWDKIFSDSRVTGLMTKKVKEDFNKKREEMGGFDLNPENVMLAFGAIFNQRHDIENACITETFDWLTWYSEKNRVYFGETWKTNSHYMVGKKIIIPCLNFYGGFDYNMGEKFDDLDRSMCILTGTKFESTEEKPFKSIANAIENDCLKYTKIKCDETDSQFFHIKLYKKGTAHLTFLSDDLRMLFNKVACEERGWQLPENETFNKKNKRK